MKTLVFLCILLADLSGWAAVTAPPSRRTQEFIVHDLRGKGNPPFNLRSEAGKRIVTLDLDVLALSAERIKRALCWELKLPPHGWGLIHLVLRSVSETEQDIRTDSVSFADGWQYRVEIPDQLEDFKLIRGIVQTLLLQYANRGASFKSAEIPFWLNEGLSMQLRNSVGPDLTPSSVPTGSMRPSVRDVLGVDTLREARSVLRSYSAVDFKELSWPATGQLQGDDLRRYQGSAQLFLEALCRLPNGRACLVSMLKELPYCWNWETAFLRAFHAYFQQMLDVEKWWTVTLIDFTGRDPTQVWPGEECLAKLDEILLISAQIRLAPDALPIRIYVSPQQVVGEWSYSLQQAVLERTIRQLVILRVNCPLEVVALIDRYRLTFQNYLHKRAEASAMAGTRRQVTASVQLLVRGTIERLDELYRRREALHRDYLSAGSSPTSPSTAK